MPIFVQASLISLLSFEFMLIGLIIFGMYLIGFVSILGSALILRSGDKVLDEILLFIGSHNNIHHHYSDSSGRYLRCDCPEMQKVLYYEKMLNRITRGTFNLQNNARIDYWGRRAPSYWFVDHSDNTDYSSIRDFLSLAIVWPIFSIIAIFRSIRRKLQNSIKKLIGIHKQPEIDKEEMQYRNLLRSAREEMDTLIPN